MKIDRLDHLVLTVASIRSTCDFYANVLGMKVIRFGAGRIALRYGMQKINLHEAGKEFEPKALRATPGSADLCFVTSLPIADVVKHITGNGIEIIEGPVQRAGAQGAILSVYLRDPDENLIEISNYL